MRTIVWLWLLLVVSAFSLTFTMTPPQACYPIAHDIVVTKEGVTKLFKGLNPSKALGPDELHPRALKELAMELGPVFAHLFQQSIDTECYPIADVVFLVDGSDSISLEEFKEQKTFIRRFVEMSDIGADKIRVGFAVVSSWIGDTMNLTSGSVKDDILIRVDGIKQQQEGSRTDVGIAFLDEMFYKQGRMGAMYIGIILTDGRPKYKEAMIAEADVAKNSGIFLITIGVGRNIQDELLQKMASTPSNSYHMKPMNYSLILLRETVKYLGKEWCSDVVSALPPSSKGIKQKDNVFDPGLNVSNTFQDVSLLAKSESNANKNQTEENSTNAQNNIIMGQDNQSLNAQNTLEQVNQASSVGSHNNLNRQSKITLPQTTVFPVTRSNLGKILQALVNSKRAKSQGIAFVKSRKDLKDALRILFVSRGIGVNIMNQSMKDVGRTTEAQLNPTKHVTTEPLIQVSPTFKTTFTTLTDDNYGVPSAKDLQIQQRNSNTESQIGYQVPVIKATQPTIFKQAPLDTSTGGIKQLETINKMIAEKTKAPGSYSKTVVKPSISKSAISLEEEMLKDSSHELKGANANQKGIGNNVIGQTTSELVEKHIMSTSHLKPTESSIASNSLKTKPEAAKRLAPVLSAIYRQTTIIPDKKATDMLRDVQSKQSRVTESEKDLSAIKIKLERPVSLLSDIPDLKTTKPNSSKPISYSKIPETNIVSKLAEITPKESAITDKFPTSVFTKGAVQQTITPPALANLLRTRLALLGRRIISLNATTAKPFITYTTPKNENAGESVLAVDQSDITPSVTQISTRNNKGSSAVEERVSEGSKFNIPADQSDIGQSDITPSVKQIANRNNKDSTVVEGSISKGTEYNIPTENELFKSKVSYLKSTSDIKPYSWLSKPTTDLTTMKLLETTSTTKENYAGFHTKPSTEKTKTFSEAGISGQIEQPVSSKEAQQVDGKLGQTTESSISMTSDTRKLSLNVLNEFQKYNSIFEKGKPFFDPKIAFVKGITGAQSFHSTSTTEPAATKKIQPDQDNSYGPKSAGMNARVHHLGHSGKEAHKGILMDNRMTRIPSKQYGQVPMSPTTMFSTDRKMTFMTLKPPKKSDQTIQKQSVPNFPIFEKDLELQSQISSVPSKDFGISRIPYSKLRNTNVQKQKPGMKMNFPAVRSPAAETQSSGSDGKQGIYTLESYLSDKLSAPNVQSQVPFVKKSLPINNQAVPDVEQRVIKVLTDVIDSKRRISDADQSVADIQPKVTNVQSSVSDVTPSASIGKLPDSSSTVSDVPYDISRSSDVKLHKPSIQVHSFDTQRHVSDVRSSRPEMKTDINNVQPIVTGAQSHIPDIQLTIPGVNPSFTEVKTRTAVIESNVIGSKQRIPKLQPRYSGMKPRTPELKSFGTEVKPLVPVVKSMSQNDRPRASDIQQLTRISLSRDYGTDPLVVDAAPQVPDAQKSFINIQPSNTGKYKKADITDTIPRTSIIQQRITDIPADPVTKPHVQDVNKQTALRNNINHGKHFGNKLKSTPANAGAIRQVSNLLGLENEYEFGSTINKGSFVRSYGKLNEVNEGKVKGSSSVHIDVKGSYGTKTNRPMENAFSPGLKHSVPPKHNVPRYRTTTQNILKVPPTYKMSDDGYNYEPVSQKGRRQKQSYGAKFSRRRQSNGVSVVIEHPEHNHTLDKAAALNLCLKSRYFDGIGYTHRPNSCTDFLQCIRVNGHIKLEVGHCPMGTVFDEQSAICRPYNMHYCPRDPCSDNKIITYGHPSNCRGYLRCQSGRSMPYCCPEGFAYSAIDDTCVMNPNCTVPCLEETPACNTSPFKTNDKFYFENFPGFGWLIRTCPLGSRYSQSQCKCQAWTQRETKVECSPHVSLDFEERFDTNEALHNKNVKVEKGVGKFEGKSMITLWRFTGVSFGKSVLITMRFKIPDPEKNSNKLMHLLSNCCIGCRGRPGPTIDIAVLPDAAGGMVILSSYSTTSGEKFIFIPYKNTDTGWNTLVYSYDGNWLVGTVNGVTGRQQMKGTIESRPYPLLLGSCGTVPSFKGYIDDFKIYLCKS